MHTQKSHAEADHDGSNDLQAERWPVESNTPGKVVRYRGFVLIPEDDLSWQVRPERSPMHVLPFRAPACSLADVKALVDWRLAKLGRDRRPKVDLLPNAQPAQLSPSQWHLRRVQQQQTA